MDSNKIVELIKHRWVPAFLIPLCVIAFVVILITAIGELLLFLNDLDGNATVVTGGVVILALITVVAVFFGVRAGQGEA